MHALSAHPSHTALVALQCKSKTNAGSEHTAHSLKKSPGEEELDDEELDDEELDTSFAKAHVTGCTFSSFSSFSSRWGGASGMTSIICCSCWVDAAS
jgi:hypothetical protein